MLNAQAVNKTQQPAAGYSVDTPAVPPAALLTASSCWPAAGSGAGSGGMPLAIWNSVVKYTAQIRLSAAKPARFALELMPSVWLTPVGTTWQILHDDWLQTPGTVLPGKFLNDDC